jgi:hypothetical protein
LLLSAEQQRGGHAVKRGVYRIDMRDLVLLLGLPADTEIVSVSVGTEHVDFLINHSGLAEIPDGE